MRDMKEGVATHPLVAYFCEEHAEKQQEVLMGFLTRHFSPVDRQVKESLNILKASKSKRSA